MENPKIADLCFKLEGMSLKRSISVLFVVVTLVALAACSTTDASPAPGGSSSPTSAGVVKPTALKDWQPYGGEPALWFDKKAKPVSRVVNVKGVAVVYLQKGKKVFLTGLDPVTGKKMWEKEAETKSRGGQTWRVLTAQEKYVAYLEPGSKSKNSDFPQSRVVLLDPTGASSVAAKSEIHTIFSPPDSCSAGVTGVCLDVADQKIAPARFAIGMKDLEMINRPEVKYPDNMAWSEVDDNGLVRILKRSPEKDGLNYRPDSSLGVVRGGKLLWKKPMKDIAGKGFRVDTFNSDYVKSSDLYLFRASIDTESSPTSGNLSQTTALIAIKAATGEEAWRRVGVSAHYDAQFGTSQDFAEDPFVAGEWLGGEYSIKKEKDSDSGSAFTSLDVIKPVLDIVRVNLDNGEVAWRHHIGEVTLDKNSSFSIYPSGDSGLIVAIPNNPVYLSLADGAARPAAPDEVGWSEEKSGVNVEYETQPDGYPVQKSDGESLIDKPVASGQDSPTITLPLPERVVTKFGNVGIVATPRGLVAYVL